MLIHILNSIYQFLLYLIKGVSYEYRILKKFCRNRG